MRIRSFLILLLLIPISFSQFFDFEMIGNYVLPGTILAVSALLGIAWMASDMFNNPQLKAWVKMELRSLVSAGVLLVLVYVLFFGTNSFASLITGEDNIGEAANIKLDSYMNVLKPAYEDMIRASHYVGIISGFGFTAPTFLWYASYNYVSSPHTGVRPLQTMIVQGAGSVSQVLFIYSAIKVLLQFFTTIVPTVILPIALSLRIIPYTKKIGTTLIALCIGAAIVFPISVILVGYFHDLAMVGVSLPKMDFGAFKQFGFPTIGWFCDGSGIIGVAKGFASISELGWGIISGFACCLMFPYACWAAFKACFEFTINVVFPLINLIYQGLFWIIALIDYNSFFGELDAGLIYNSLANFLQLTTYRVLMGFVDAILIIVLTIVTTKSVSEIIGGEAYLVGIQKLVG